MIEIGGKNAWREFRKSGGVVVILQWVEIPTGISGEPPVVEPCMILRAANRKVNRGTWAIPLNDLWRYVEPRYIAYVAPKIAEQIGLGAGISDGMKVIDAIQDHIDDLLDMPPAPVNFKNPVTIGDMKFLANGKTLSERLLMSDGTVH